MRIAIILLTVLSLAVPALAQTAPSPMSSAPPITWSPPTGWKTETIPFPLDFAPSLPYTGYEELRFSPDFGKADQPLFFTYAFLWVIPATVELTRAQIERDLKIYFDGLMTAVAASKKIEGVTVNTKVTVSDAAPGPDKISWTVNVETYDAFFTRKPIKLVMNVIQNVKVWPAWRVHYFEATTDPMKPEVLPALQVLRANLAR